MTDTTAMSAPHVAPEYRVSVDTGGTFTDGFVTSNHGSAQVKVDTTTYDPTVGFGECIAAAASAMGEELQTFLSRARMVHFSSTIATNAVVQRLGARVGLIVTAGNESDLYGSHTQAEQLRGFLPEEAVRGVAEEVDSHGTAIRTLDADGLERAVRELLELGVHLVVVSLANAHLNPVNEIRAKAVIDRSYPKHYLGAIPLLLSSQISLVDDDHGRTALAVANAYLHPSLARSLYRAEDLIRKQGFTSPLLAVNTDGSSTRVSKTRAIDTFNSGPSAGVLGAAIVAQALGAEHVVTFDVGGTTTDVAYLRGGHAPHADRTVFGPVEIPHPAVDLWSFGLGGGSLIAYDPDTNDLAVGPLSAGAVPGPACFALGGEQATPTDVWLSLGYLQAGEFLSGRRHLELARARAVVGALAAVLDISVDEAALRAQQAIRRSLGQHVRDWATNHPELGEGDPTAKWLFSYGGGGGLLCVDAAEALGIDNVAVFPQSSVFSAFGGGLLPIAHRYHVTLANACDPAVVDSCLEVLIDRARRDLRAEGVPKDAVVEAHATLISFGSDDAHDLSAGSLEELRDGAGEKAFRLAAAGVGRVSLAIQVPRESELRVRLEASEHVSGETRLIVTAAGTQNVPVINGLGRPNADGAYGPAFLNARDTTIFVPANWSVTFNEQGYGLLQRNADHG